jgi:hypothetical protein
MYGQLIGLWMVNWKGLERKRLWPHKQLTPQLENLASWHFPTVMSTHSVPGVLALPNSWQPIQYLVSWHLGHLPTVDNPFSTWCPDTSRQLWQPVQYLAYWHLLTVMTTHSVPGVLAPPDSYANPFSNRYPGTSWVMTSYSVPGVLAPPDSYDNPFLTPPDNYENPFSTLCPGTSQQLWQPIRYLLSWHLPTTMTTHSVPGILAPPDSYDNPFRNLVYLHLGIAMMAHLVPDNLAASESWQPSRYLLPGISR